MLAPRNRRLWRRFRPGLVCPYGALSELPLTRQSDSLLAAAAADGSPHRGVGASAGSSALEQRLPRPSGATSWLDQSLSSSALLVWACVVAPSLLLPAGLPTRALLVLLLMALVSGTRRRVRWGRSAAFFGAVVGFNLAAPGGRVLLQLGAFPVTEGALNAGLGKALSLMGLLLLSKLAIRRDLELPGRHGRLLSLTLAYVRYLLDANVKLLARDPVGRLDGLLLEAQASVDAQPPPKAAAIRSTAAGITILAALAALHWTVALVGP